MQVRQSKVINLIKETGDGVYFLFTSTILSFHTSCIEKHDLNLKKNNTLFNIPDKHQK